MAWDKKPKDRVPSDGKTSADKGEKMCPGPKANGFRAVASDNRSCINENAEALDRRPCNNENAVALDNRPCNNENAVASGKRPCNNETSVALGKRPCNNENAVASGKRPCNNEKKGAKMFGFYPSVQDFYESLLTLPAGRRYGYEIIVENKPCRSYADVEWEGGHDATHDRIRVFVRLPRAYCLKTHQCQAELVVSCEIILG